MSRDGDAEGLARVDAIVDRELALVENPGFRAGTLGPLVARYRQEADAIATALAGAPGYAPTACHRLDRLARAIGCRTIRFKDEGQRFGLGSFKSAGAVYAMVRHVERVLGERLDPAAVLRGAVASRLADLTFATATSGNHGRALAWVAQCIGARCVIYAPSECSEGRIAEMARYGARIVRTGVLYNAAMERCRADCARNGWTLFADTSWDDYVDIPTDIMLGYAHIVRELADQIDDWQAITHVVIQGGVGAFATGLLTGLACVDPDARIQAIVVEPRDICALQTSALRGAPTAIAIAEMSLMTGISNAEISVAAWPTVSQRVRWFAGIGDTVVRPCLSFFHSGGLDGIPIEMGETAAAGISTWISLMRTGHRAAIGEGAGALVFGCEGVTDRAIYRRLIDAAA